MLITFCGDGTLPASQMSIGRAWMDAELARLRDESDRAAQESAREELLRMLMEIGFRRDGEGEDGTVQ